MSAKVMRWYYLEPSMKLVFVYQEEQFPTETSTLEFIGSTDNPFPKMAVAAFLKDGPGHRIVDYTSM